MCQSYFFVFRIEWEKGTIFLKVVPYVLELDEIGAVELQPRSIR